MEVSPTKATSFSLKVASPFYTVAEESDGQGEFQESDVEGSVDNFKDRSIWKSPMVSLQVVATLKYPPARSATRWSSNFDNTGFS